MADLVQDLYYYNLHTKNRTTWTLGKVVTYEYYVKQLDRLPNKCRTSNGKHRINGGWHLSYFGDSQFIQNKIQMFSHQEFNHPTYTELEVIEQHIKNGDDLFNRSHPECTLINLPIDRNNNLPPRYEQFLSKYL